MAARVPHHTPVSPGYYPTDDHGYVQITDTQSGKNLASANTLPDLCAAAGVPLAISDGAIAALISVEGAGIRWIADGQTPTATYGNPVGAGQAFNYTGIFSALKLIRQAAGAIVNVNFER